MALREEESLASALRRAVALRRFHVRLYQALSTLFTPAYQSDGRLLPWIRDRIVPPSAAAGRRPGSRRRWWPGPPAARWSGSGCGDGAPALPRRPDYAPLGTWRLGLAGGTTGGGGRGDIVDTAIVRTRFR